MQVKKKVHTLQEALSKEKKSNQTIGFVPTMGALHAGHISLIKASQANSDISVCSIFVNPTQFNEKKDLAKYPRTFKKDKTLLIKSACDYLFYPRVDDIYPPDMDISLEIDLEGLDTRMEGAFRPGHFAGVVQVVKRLLDIVKPNYLFMGQKDFQQFTIIDHMIRTLDIPTKLVVCPIMREPHGLAMSSRNERLTAEERIHAGLIHKVLLEISSQVTHTTISELENKAMESLNTSFLTPEYVSIINGYTLLPVENMNDSPYIVVCVAVWCGKIRLIDNLILKKNSSDSNYN